MSNTAIQLKKSGITGNTPVGLNPGEVAINYADGKLFYLDSTDSLSYITNQDTFNTIIANNHMVLATNPTDILTLSANNGISIDADVDGKRIFVGVNETQINSFVKKTGDTMTGDLNISTANIDANYLIVETTLYSGLATRSSTPLPNLIAQFSSNSAGYVQVNQQNINGKGSADYVITADVGNDTDFYIDAGMLGSQYEPGAYNNLGTASNPLDGYLIVQGSTIGQAGGNLIIGTVTSNTAGLNTKIVSGGSDAENIVAEFGENSVKINRDLAVTGNISSQTITNLQTDIQTVYDAANNAAGNAFTTIIMDGYTDVVANSKSSSIRIVGESGVAVGSDAGNNVIAIGANFVGASNIVLDYGTTAEIGYITFDYGYLS